MGETSRDVNDEKFLKGKRRDEHKFKSNKQ